LEAFMTVTLAYASAFALVMGIGYLLMPMQALAAHAGAPYTNVDHSNDIGNDTGDSRVDSLNSGQLNQIYHGPLELRPPAANPSTAMAPQSAEPPPPPAEMSPH
jgi:hypothetical protein